MMKSLDLHQSVFYSKRVLNICFAVVALLSVSSSYRTTSRCSRFSSKLNLIDPDTLANYVVPQLGTVGHHLICAADLPAISDSNPLSLILSTGESHLGWLNVIDAARFPFFPKETSDFLLTIPIIIRLGLGFFALDVIPTVIDFVFLRTIWSNFIAVKRPYKEIDITSLPRTYDIDTISAFCSKFPRLVIARTSEIAFLAKDFLLAILGDFQKGTFKSNQPTRSAELAKVMIALGPTFIKIGQALSTRPDLISPIYLEEFLKLEQQVPSFTTDEAVNIIEGELKGMKIVDLFETLDSFQTPVTTQNLGQVYKCKLKKSGAPVSVRVQRPDMLLTFSLDLFIIRGFFRYCQLFPTISEKCEGLVRVVDKYAEYFFEELDFTKESIRTDDSTLQIRTTPLRTSSAIVVPMTYKEHSSEKVLISEWMDVIE